LPGDIVECHQCDSTCARSNQRLGVRIRVKIGDVLVEGERVYGL
jgi:hypothetical protein